MDGGLPLTQTPIMQHCDLRKGGSDEEELPVCCYWRQVMDQWTAMNRFTWFCKNTIGLLWGYSAFQTIVIQSWLSELWWQKVYWMFQSPAGSPPKYVGSCFWQFYVSVHPKDPPYKWRIYPSFCFIFQSALISEAFSVFLFLPGYCSPTWWMWSPTTGYLDLIEYRVIYRWRRTPVIFCYATATLGKLCIHLHANISAETLHSPPDHMISSVVLTGWSSSAGVTPETMTTMTII